MRRVHVKPALFYATLAAVLGLCAVAPRLDLGESRSAVMASAILVFAILNWIAETAPIAVTSLAVVAITPLTGLMSFSQSVQKSFGNSIFGFFLGVLLLSYAFRETDLGKLISRGIFRLFGKSPRGVVLGIMISGALLAMWVTEVAAAAIVFPIALSIWDKAAGREDHAALGRAMMLGVAWGCAFGGVATPIATGANLIAVSYLEEYCGISVDFGQWMLIGVPICATLIAVGWLILTRPLKNREPLQTGGEAVRFGRREKWLSVIFGCAVMMWVFGGLIGLESYHAALICALMMFLPGVEVAEWKKAIQNISWDSILLICAGVLIGDLLYSSGVAETLARAFFVPQLLSGGLLVRGVYIVLSVSVLKILFSSNTVSGVVLVPIMISLATAYGLSPWGVVAPGIFSSALSLIVISSSPVNVIPYSSRAFTPGDMARYGLVMTVLTALIIGGWLALLGVN